MSKYGLENRNLKPAYLYSTVLAGEFRVYNGFVEAGNPSRIPRQIGLFYFGNNRVSVSKIAGDVYNAMVWLEERDDQKAREILIAHYKEKIRKEQDTIRKYQNKINRIEGDVNYYEDYQYGN